MVVALKEFRGFVDVDLCDGMKNMDRSAILVMYNCDLYLFITKNIPFITTVVVHMKKVIDGYDSLDMYQVGANTIIVSETSNKIKRSIDINQPLAIDYKPVTYNVANQLKSIDAFEAKAVEHATTTEEVVARELADFQKTLSNIDAARPFDQLTADDIVKVRPDIDDKVHWLVSKGKWSAPRYKEKFGDLNVM